MVCWISDGGTVGDVGDGGDGGDGGDVGGVGGVHEGLTQGRLLGLKEQWSEHK